MTWTSAGSEFDSTADMLEGLIQRSWRATTGEPAPAARVRAEAERVAPEFVRMWNEGKNPGLHVDADDAGQITVEVES